MLQTLRTLLILLLCGFPGLATLCAQVATIPFELQKDIILVQVRVNDHPEPRTFVFDTGATSDLLDQTVASELGVEPNYQQEVPGAGGVNTFDIALSQRLTVGQDIEIDGTHLVLTDLSKLRTALERNFDGILGYSLLKRYVTWIDFDSRQLLLYNDIAQVDTTGYTQVPFSLDNGIPIPQFDITITLRNGRGFTGKILFDSGAALTLMVNTPFDRANKLGDSAQKQLVMESNNLGSRSLSRQIAIESMEVAGMQLGEMVIALANDTEGVSSYQGYLGILGGQVISRFHCILDYDNAVLYLKPNDRFGQPFEFPVSGLLLKMEEGEIVIRRVQQSSPAYGKGVRSGDRLLSINGNNSGDLQQYRDLLKQEGKVCRLELQAADGTIKKVEIPLERLL